MNAKHIIFIGQVQGVGFRYRAQRIAKEYQLTGWVKNLPDGSVEMFAQGQPQDVDNCISEIQTSFTGFVRETKINEHPYNPRYISFKITY
jgi:acylphosphatase